MIGPLSQSIWQARVPAAVQGRVFVARQALANAAFPLAHLATGPLVDRVLGPAFREGGAGALPAARWRRPTAARRCSSASSAQRASVRGVAPLSSRARGRGPRRRPEAEPSARRPRRQRPALRCRRHGGLPHQMWGAHLGEHPIDRDARCGPRVGEAEAMLPTWPRRIVDTGLATPAGMSGAVRRWTRRGEAALVQTSRSEDADGSVMPASGSLEPPNMFSASDVELGRSAHELHRAVVDE